MKFVVLGGAGMVGSTVAKDLAGLKDVQEVCIADINLDNARKKAAEIGSIATAKAADINNPKALADLFRDYKVVVNCVGPFYLNGPKVLEAAIKSKINYVDVCDDYDATELLLTYHDKCSKAGITAILSFGASPGFTNMCGLLGSQRMDSVDEIHSVFVQTLNSVEGEGAFSTIWHGIHMAHGEVPQFLNGELVKTPAMTGKEDLTFLPPLAHYPVYYLGHPEPILLSRSIKGLKNATLKGNIWGGDLELGNSMKPFLDLGFGDRDPMKFLGQDTTVRDFFVQYLIQFVVPTLQGSITFQKPEDYFEFIIRSDVRGKIDGKDAQFIYLSNMPINAGTGGSAAYGAYAIGTGKVTAKGCFGPEACVDPNDYFKHMESYKGIKLYETRSITGKCEFK